MKISLKELWGLFLLCVKRPLYVVPTMRATSRCVAICDTLYGKKHHEHNAANAVRHALWNILIAKYCFRWNKNADRALAWTHLITDWHEDFSVNKPLERAMDLHNNEVGRALFYQIKDYSDENIVTHLQEKATYAKQISHQSEVHLACEELVYLSL